MAAQSRGEDVYASLLLTDTYLPGALVLAHSLRDAGTKKKLAILVTLDSVSAEVITELKAVYDYVIPVPRIRNEKPANLYLMDRPDLHSAFTKVNLWKQTQFRRIVYIDADVVAFRAPDELFDLPYAFAAAPDIGWPDLFNTGVMALTPNMGDYYALMAMAERGISFDGADQGLLNMYFKDSYHRLSFTYNVTPSGHYQYIPAYRHFQSSINMVHFIGAEKPWVQGRDARAGSSPYDEMVGRWWAVYDRHYRKQEPALPSLGTQQSGQPAPQPAPPPPPEIVQYFVKGEYQPKVSYVVPVGEPSRSQTGDFHPQQQPPASHFEYHHHHHQHHNNPSEYHHQGQENQDAQNQYHHYHEQAQPASSAERHEQSNHVPSELFQSAFRAGESSHTEAREEQAPGHHQGDPPPPPHQPEHRPEPPQPPPAPSWDAQRMSPPSDSKPEASNFPQMHYEMSSDTKPFVPPERYPSPPKDMWYEVPKEAPAPRREKPPPIFPWETHQPAPTRVFADDFDPPPPVLFQPREDFSADDRPSTADSEAQGEPSLVEESSSVADHQSEPQTPTTPTVRVIPAEAFSSFTRTNAWDDVPEIDRYVEALQKHRRTRSGGLRLGSLPPAGPDQLEDAIHVRRGSRVTDFPSEVDRPSLPVTPAPTRRPKFWGGGGPGFGLDGGGDDEQLPAAEGVPAQAEWDPLAQLQKLARQQSELLLQKLGDGASARGEIPSRSLPFGSEPVMIPQPPAYVSPSAPSPVVLSPQPVKPGSRTSPVRQLFGVEPEIFPAVAAAPTIPDREIMLPSYQGPSAAFEKGEDLPSAELLPRVEDRDVEDADEM